MNPLQCATPTEEVPIKLGQKKQIGEHTKLFKYTTKKLQTIELIDGEATTLIERIDELIMTKKDFASEVMQPKLDYAEKNQKEKLGRW